MKDETGKKYGRLTVVKLDHIDRKKGAMWLCACECGCTTVVTGNRLRIGKTRSCGCLKKEAQQNFGVNTREGSSRRMKAFNKTFWTPDRREENRIKSTIHGGTGTRLFKIWSRMKERCESEKGTHARWYHDKGIRICDEWQDFRAFREWAYANGYYDQDTAENEYKNLLSIDRIDPEKGYYPENCRWITISENSRFRNEYHADQR